MKLDWSRVKKQTLWSYEDLIKKLQGVLAYEFVQEHYDHTMKQAQRYARKVRGGYLQNQGNTTAYIDAMMANLEKLETLRHGRYSHLIAQVATREQCLAFIQRTGFDFDSLIQTLNYLMRWVLPFKTPVREFVDVDCVAELKTLEVLKQHKVGSNLDILAVGQTKAARLLFSRLTGISVAYVTALVHKADISRLAYVRGKTVKHLCGGGYDTLAKIAGANLVEMEKRMDVYYRTMGKSVADFRAVIPLAWMVGGAQILPRVVRE
ncbi:MAG: hypothetical protein QY328_11345 [Anaerolineales bacterium]|nr:MAG: hypothetical protein QY328_11230 [Anaerolineales bacterium]WKZ38851.1 MAG: hypothetical protein QY328_11345 [Anaerolineales bacterium]